MSSSGSSSNAKFRHTRLSSPCFIRILKLHQAADFGAFLEVTLSEIDLDNVPNNAPSDFEALSYVWGSQVGTQSLLCDGRLLLVTPSCESALRHLRHEDVPRMLWVDAICIDQGDDQGAIKERSAQVAMMGEIYARAKRTLCWFGPGNDYTVEVMRLLERIGSCPSSRGLNKLLTFDHNLRRKNIVDKDKCCLDSIFTHPWHSRIWTVQEVAYSKDPYIACGKASIPWSTYVAAANFLVFESFIPNLDAKANEHFVTIDVRDVLRNHIRDSPSDNPREDLEDEDEDEVGRRIVTLSSCLSDVNQLQATEPKDKIYGIHSLYTALGIPLPPVEYEISLAQVYQDAAVAMMVWSCTLNVLGDSCSISRKANLPSWVPDWSDGDIKLFTPIARATNGSKLVDPKAELLCPNFGELYVRGKIVGKVIPWLENKFDEPIFPTRPEECTLRVLRDMKDGFAEDVDTIRLWMEKTRYFRQLYASFHADKNLCNGLEPEEAFFDILTQKCGSEPEDIFDIWTDILRYPTTTYSLAFGETLFEQWRHNDDVDDAEWTEELVCCGVIMAALLSSSIKYNDRPLGLESDILDLLNHFSGNFADKAIMLVDRDSLEHAVLGTSFHTVTDGDSVALLEGADYPVVLQRTGSKWQFVGPAYVTGIMNGEAWLGESGDFGDLENFVLV